MSKLDIQKLYKEHAHKVRGLAFRYVGESALDDMVQEIFFKVWQKQHQFKGGSKISTWIYRVAVNTCLDFLRKRKRIWNQAAKLKMLTPETSHKDKTFELKETIESCLFSIDEKHRDVIVLVLLEEFTYKEAGEILSVPTGTVKSRVHKGAKKLRELLASKGFKKNEAV
jgi:RNA polymerase sigma-70 factor (ECF subfamily)